MRILVFTLLYKPDGGPSAPLFGMLCERLARRGHDVSIVAAVPHYPSGRVPPEFKKRWIQRSWENGVRVVRVRVPSIDRTRLPLRLLQFLIYQVGATVAGWPVKCDVMLVTNPAIESGLPLAILSAVKRAPAIFSVYDVYPDVGVQLGIFRSRFVVRAVGAAERYCLSRARIVHALSESFALPLRRLGVPEEAMAYINVWIDTDIMRPMPRDNGFAREFGLVDKFVVLYAGNIGLSQGLGHVLAAAEILAPHEKIRFVFVGDGSGREALLRHAEERGLGNVQFIPFQAASRVPEVLGSADLALVSLQSQVGVSSLPSKTFSYLAAQRPVIVMADEGNPAWQLIESAKAGSCLPHGDPDRLSRLILELQAAPALREAMGRSGRAYVERHHSAAKAAEDFETLMKKAIHDV